MLTELHYLTVMLFHKPLLDLSHSRALLGLVSTISTSAIAPIATTRFIGLVWLVWLVWLIWLIWLVRLLPRLGLVPAGAAGGAGLESGQHVGPATGPGSAEESNLYNAFISST